MACQKFLGSVRVTGGINFKNEPAHVIATRACGTSVYQPDIKLKVRAVIVGNQVTARGSFYQAARVF
jgi:hypothetical protein